MNAFGITDRGVVRKENQDTFRYELIAKDEILCAVLCDGMGGAQAGSLASTIASDTFMSHAAYSLDSTSDASDMQRILVEAVNYANIKVYDRSFADFSCMGMGCTLVAVLINSKRCLIANVGDSRAYLINKANIQQISRDHSLVEELLAKGKIKPEQVKNHPQKNIITRAIGVEASVKCDVFDIKFTAGSRILLCSDGLSNVLSDKEILTISQENPDVESACKQMLNLALRRGAPDNVTVFIAQR
ncbi:MAG: Stp1/IreP family PP2C-type Ser/Thr phosphatase [Ruminococcaceae bacterium]|nr:Stp1/IreP family PP2C-type Ser/Thr phosphatase [Oscillospiraceae bacterium]